MQIRSMQMKRQDREKGRPRVKVFYARWKAYVIDVYRILIIFHANFSPSLLSFRRVATNNTVGRDTNLSLSLSLVLALSVCLSAPFLACEDFRQRESSGTRVNYGGRLFLPLPRDVHEMRKFSRHVREDAISAARIHPRLGFGPSLRTSLPRPRSNLMIMRERREVYFDFIACEMRPFFLL